jgi:hypothetical protein
LAYLLHMLKLSTPPELIRQWLWRCPESSKWATGPPSVSGCARKYCLLHNVRDGMTHTWR